MESRRERGIRRRMRIGWGRGSMEGVWVRLGFIQGGFRILGERRSEMS